jgi:hypothetical protein
MFIEEYEGEISSIFWRNPHIGMSINVEDESGNEVIWEMEAQDLNTLGRIGVSRDMFEVGQRVRFAGWPSTRREHCMALTHLLLADNTEVVMRMRTEPRWNADALGGGDITQDPKLTDDAEANGLFRVWSFHEGNEPVFTNDPPLTDSARAALAAFDAIQDDAVRVMHIGDAENAASQRPSPLGYSVGRMENESTLVVTTTNVSWPWTKMEGLVAVPQSTDSVFIEKFEMSSDETRLRYSFSMTDPVSFTRSVTAEDYYVWQRLPGAVVEPYECTLGE